MRILLSSRGSRVEGRGSRVEGRGGHPRRILDVKYTQILMKLSQPESFASCSAGSGAETPELTPAASKWLKAEKLREGRAANYYISAKAAEWTGQKARCIVTGDG